MSDSAMISFITWGLVFLAFMVGASLASFSYAMLDRRNTYISATEPSRCVCGRRLNTFVLIPVFGWLFTGGKARCCGSRIPWKYPLSEAIAGLVVAIPVAIFLFTSF